MSSTNTKTDKKKISVSESTYEKLKTFSRFNGLKMRIAVETLVDVVLQDEALSKRIAALTLEKESDSRD